MTGAQTFTVFFFAIFLILLLILWSYENGNAKQWRLIADDLSNTIRNEERYHRESIKTLMEEQRHEMEILKYRAKKAAIKAYEKGAFPYRFNQDEYFEFCAWWRKQMNAPEER